MGWILPAGLLSGLVVAMGGTFVYKFDSYSHEAINLFAENHPELATLANIPLAQVAQLSPEMAI